MAFAQLATFRAVPYCAPSQVKWYWLLDETLAAGMGN